MSNILNVGKNHSLRATTITVLDVAGISGRHSIKVSGPHSSLTPISLAMARRGKYQKFSNALGQQPLTTGNEAGTENPSDLASVSTGDFELDCLINEEI